MLTLEQAIASYEKSAERYHKSFLHCKAHGGEFYQEEAESNKICYEHDCQLSEWLRELQERRKADNEIPFGDSYSFTELDSIINAYEAHGGYYKEVVELLKELKERREQSEIAKTIGEQEGEWIPVHPIHSDDPGAYMCSKCKTGMWEIRPSSYHYCPFCGTKMKGAKDAAK